jgi:hypothetical protein
MKYTSFLSHSIAAVIITVVMITIYACVQQGYRSSANDPQLQMARDLSSALSKGSNKSLLMPADSIDLTKSLAVFETVFDGNGNPLHSTGFLNGALPNPPAGVFKVAGEYNENAVTWQPQSNVRMALVVAKIAPPGNGFVGVGRSLKEIEIRESNLVKMIGIAWGACMFLLTIHLLLQQYFIKRNVK